MRRFVNVTFLTLIFLITANPALSFQAVKQFEETSYYLKDVCFVNVNDGWAVGEPHWYQGEKKYKGTIIKTTDGGETWTSQDAAVAVTLRGVTFVDENNGWAVGMNGTILHTNNGGSNWTVQSVDTVDEFMGVAFVDADNGWATSIKTTHYNRQGDPDNWQGSIWHTKDGGETWAKQSIPDNASLLNRIDFLDADNGWSVGTKSMGFDANGFSQQVGTVYSTNDGGETWKELYNAGLEIVLKGVDFVDKNNGWVVGFPTRSSLTGGFVYHTTNGGTTWERQEPGDIFAPLWDVQFIDQNNGYVVGFDYIAAWGPPVWRTIDGGITWEKVIMEAHESEGLFGVSIVGDQVIAVGDHDFVAKSSDAWKSCDFDSPKDPICFNCGCLFTQFYINIHYKFEDVFFADETHGRAVGKRSYEPEQWGQAILYTDDGGENWEIQYEQAPAEGLFSFTFRLDKVFFTDNQTGWAVGGSDTVSGDGWEHHGAILHTTDGGLNWEEQGSELYESWDLEFVSVQFLDARNGWALADKKFPEETIFLVHTTDGGISWEWVDTGIEGRICIGFTDPLGDLFFSDAQHGWAVGSHDIVLHTDDGGNTWTRQELPEYPSRLRAVAFLNNQEGWIAGASLYHTTNGGSSWLEKETGFSGDFQDIHFPDSVNGWLVGDSGGILHTDDGGNTWDTVDKITSSTLRGVFSVNSQKGWSVGDYGTIIAMDVSAPTMLSGLSISGPISVNEGDTATYTATARWSDGSTSAVTPTWSEDSSIASISADGVLSTPSVTNDQTVTITARYSFGGVTETATELVTIINLQNGDPAPANGGYKVTSDLWAKAVLQTHGKPVTLVWKLVGSDITPSGDQVISGYYYADPDDFVYGSKFNPEVFVKIYIASTGWANIAFNHVTVDDVTVFSTRVDGGTPDQSGVISLQSRFTEHTYSGVSIDNDLSLLNSDPGISDNLATVDDGYAINSKLWSKAILHVANNPVTLIWKEVGSDSTLTGDRVISGYFYADPNDFAYGSKYNPEVFVKIYIAADGWTNIAYNHVTVDDVSVYSTHQDFDTQDQSDRATLANRLKEHSY